MIILKRNFFRVSIYHRRWKTMHLSFGIVKQWMFNNIIIHRHFLLLLCWYSFLWLLIPFLSTSLPLQVKSRTNANGTVAAGASPALTNSLDTIASIRVTSHSNVLTVTGRSQDRTISRFTWRDTELLQTEQAIWMDVRVLFWCCLRTAMVEGSRLWCVAYLPGEL